MISDAPRSLPRKLFRSVLFVSTALLFGWYLHALFLPDNRPVVYRWTDEFWEQHCEVHDPRTNDAYVCESGKYTDAELAQFRTIDAKPSYARPAPSNIRGVEDIFPN